MAMNPNTPPHLRQEDFLASLTVYFNGKLHYSDTKWNHSSPASLADLLDQPAAVRASCMEDGVLVREAPPDLNFTSLPRSKTGPATVQETT